MVQPRDVRLPLAGAKEPLAKARNGLTGGAASVGEDLLRGGVVGEILAVGRFLADWRTYVLVVVALIAIAVGYQVKQPSGVDVGSSYDSPLVQGFHDIEKNAEFSYRWASSSSTVFFPGYGSAPSKLSLRLSGWRPAGGKPPKVDLSVNGRFIAEFEASSEFKTYEFALSRSRFLSGDLVVQLNSETFRPEGDRRDLGVMVDFVGIEAVDPSLLAPVIPSAPQSAYLLLVVLLFWATLRRLRVPSVYGVSSGFVVALSFGATLALWRMELTVFSIRLVVLFALGYLLVIILHRLLSWLFERAGLQIQFSEMRWLLLIFLAGFFLKVGGLLYPQIVIIDESFHLSQIRKILDGRFWTLYFPGDLALSVMPPDQWSEKAIIPYSPFFYLLASPLALVPVSLSMAVSVANGFLEATKVLLIFFVGRKAGLSGRASLIGGYLATMTPSTFLLLQWGNWPTTFSHWLALVSIALLVGLYDRIKHWWALVILTLSFTLTFLSYTVTAVFMVMMGAGILALWRWLGPKDLRRDNLKYLTISLVAGFVLAFLLYYVQYVGVVLGDTIPTFARTLNQGGGLGVKTRPWPEYLGIVVDRLWAYGLVPVLMFSVAGLALVGLAVKQRFLFTLLAAWFAIFVIFTIVGYRVDMVFKQAWFVIPAVALGTGVVLSKSYARGLIGRVVTLGVCAYLPWTALVLWVTRIVFSHH